MKNGQRYTDINHYGSNLCYLRKQEGLSQEAFAAKLGVTRSRVCSWETGNSMPSTDVLSKMAYKLEYPVDTLLRKNLETGEEVPLLIGQVDELLQLVSSKLIKVEKLKEKVLSEQEKITQLLGQIKAQLNTK